MEKMKALVSDAGQVAYGERDLPARASSDIRLAVLRCGICGSDLHWYRQSQVPALCPGHEIVGAVTGRVPASSEFREGERVTVEAVRSCGQCEFCKIGSRQFCRSLGLMGVNRPGGFAEFVDVLPGQLHTVPELLSSEVAAFAEPLAVAVHAMRLAPAAAGKRALVLGGGTMGLLTAFCLVRAGASRVDITAKRPQQKEAALQLGSSAVLEPGSSEANLYDLVFESVGGDGGTLVEAMTSVRPGGTVVMLGVFENAPPLPALHLLSKEIRLIGSMCYGTSSGVADFTLAHEILADVGDNLQEVLLTHSYPLHAIAEAFSVALDKESGSIKVQIKI